MFLFSLIKTKINDKWAWDTVFKTFSSLPNSYYSLANILVRKLFKYVPFKWDIFHSEYKKVFHLNAIRGN